MLGADPATGIAEFGHVDVVGIFAGLRIMGNEVAALFTVTALTRRTMARKKDDQTVVLADLGMAGGRAANP